MYAGLPPPRCGAKDRLTADHIVPVSVKPEWAYAIENVQILCAPCNSVKGTSYTQAHYDAVEARISAAKARRQQFYASQG
jgi:5-methylcytosine-specific restriction endonuclease McrA